MKLLYCVSVTALLVLCEGVSWTNSWTNSWTTSRTTTYPTTYPTTYTNSYTNSYPTTYTNSYPTTYTNSYPTYPYTTVGPAVNLKGKMVTLSEYSGVTFYPPYYDSAAGKHPTPQWTNRYYTTPPPTSGVSVCLRFLTDYNNFPLFKLAPGSPLTLSLNSLGYTLTWNYYSQMFLNPRFFLWSPVRSQPWTSACVIVDSVKNVVQLFQGGAMSIRKIPPSRMVWSGEPVLDLSGFDGQVTDIEVWDYPLKYGQIYSYMQNYGSSGTVLTWSNIRYRQRGNILLEETYALQQRKTISSSEDQEQPISLKHGWGQRFKHRNERKQRRRQKKTQQL